MRTKSPSLVWQFFDRVIENERCTAVTCKLCDSQYKFFGNTTNLRVHLSNKHPIQWDLLQNGNLDASTLRVLDDEDTIQSTFGNRRGKKYSKIYADSKNVSYSLKRINSRDDEEETMPKFEIQRIDVLNHSDTDCEQVNEDENATIHIMRQMNEANGEEEWLEEPFHTYKPQTRKRKYKKIKKEVDDSSHRLSSFLIQDQSYEKPEKHVIVAPQKDEYSVFGEYVANKLRKLEEPHIRGNLQQLITTVLWQAEYGMYSDPDSVKHVLLNCFQHMSEVRVNQEEVINHEVEVIHEESNQKG